MCLESENTDHLSSLPILEPFDSIGIGPGIGKNKDTEQLLKNLLEDGNKPMVLDADAINILSDKPKLLDKLPQNCILTPHIKEFDRLVGESESSLERLQKLKNFCKKYNATVVLKDAYTCVCTPSKNLYYNTTGNQGMATGGSGDVLNGIITSLLAQGYATDKAALIGTYFHGKAGDSALKNNSYTSLIAYDIIKNIRIEKN